MDAARWDRVQVLFHAVADLAPNEQRRVLDIVLKQTDPSIGWLTNARKDLVAEYDSLGMPQKAARYAAELADTLKAAVATKPK